MLDEVVSAEAPEAVGRGVVRVLPRLIRMLAAEMHRAPGTHDLTLPQFRVLSRLSERDYRAAELADALEVGRPTLTSTVDGLVRRALVERQRDLPGDRRGVLLRLTPAGRTLHRALEARAIAGVAALLADASPAECEALAVGLAALERGLQDACRTARLDAAEVS
ncbi:MAG TPA: MarR family transcriptional regulator [Chloroflexota bacterium]|nr:MarR family transcriptional regulator [Chloroflexota bacterium]